MLFLKICESGNSQDILRFWTISGPFVLYLFICFEFGFSQYYAQAPKVEPPPPEKAPKKNAAKPSEKKGKAVEAAKEAPLDPLEEKLRQQRWVSAILKKKNKTK